EKENVNIKVLIEGEEEVGSPGLEGILEEKKEKLQADHIFIVDLDMVDEKTPAVTLGIRGVATVNATVKNSVTDLHSGVFGGVVYNPARALSQVVGKMWDDAGRVTIPGFYDTIQPLSDEEKASLDWDRDLKEEGASFNIQVFQGEGDFSLVESNWIRPTLEINGMGSGYMGEGTKTIIPKEAFVKISCRLVAGQDPKQIGKGIETFLKKNLPDDIELKVEMGHGTRGMMTSPHSRAAKEMMKAYEQVFETKCKRQLCGATIPIAPMLEKVCGGELILIGVGLPSDRMHAPNECFSLKRLRQGFLSIAELLISFSRGRTK
ncbi:MAG: M20/M25/M40 family metallo-hydrolase, partial [Chlamydiia bacterium]|nr:M20/M25/M40 family metallo-hydrolase [Chlamydiia bacterium]